MDNELLFKIKTLLLENEKYKEALKENVIKVNEYMLEYLKSEYTGKFLKTMQYDFLVESVKALPTSMMFEFTGWSVKRDSCSLLPSQNIFHKTYKHMSVKEDGSSDSFSVITDTAVLEKYKNDLLACREIVDKKGRPVRKDNNVTFSYNDELITGKVSSYNVSTKHFAIVSDNKEYHKSKDEILLSGILF